MMMAPSSPGRRQRAVGLEELDVELLDAQVQPFMALALAGDQPDLLGAVAVEDLAVESLLDDLPFVGKQHHRGRDDAPRAQILNAVCDHITRQHVQRVRMPEQHLRALAPPALDEVRNRALAEIHGIEVHEPVDELCPQALLEGLWLPAGLPHKDATFIPWKYPAHWFERSASALRSSSQSGSKYVVSATPVEPPVLCMPSALRTNSRDRISSVDARMSALVSTGSPWKAASVNCSGSKRCSAKIRA